MKAVVDETVIAESEDTVLLEGNHYFPPDSVDRAYLEDSDHRTTCPWKGEAQYYDVVVGDTRKENAAWYYESPSDAAAEIEGHLAFYTTKVEVVK